MGQVRLASGNPPFGKKVLFFQSVRFMFPRILMNNHCVNLLTNPGNDQQEAGSPSRDGRVC
jgi:hypothetical protein